MMAPSDVKRKAMDRIITNLAEASDILLLDAPAGIGKGLKNLLGETAEPVIIATPDDVCIRDAERLAALLSQREEPRPSTACGPCGCAAGWLLRLTNWPLPWICR